MKQPKFTRLNPDERKTSLIDATIYCLSTKGPRATSVRAICAKAGVSPGLLIHYFKGKEDLVASSYEYLTQRFEENFDVLLSSQLSAHDKLESGFKILLDGEWVSKEMLGAWVGFWSLQQNDERIQKNHFKSNERIRLTFAKLLATYASENDLIITEEQLKLVAIELAGLGDGLWLELCLDSETFDGRQAVEICMNWLEGFRLRYFSK